jgi:hypothetical protein
MKRILAALIELTAIRRREALKSNRLAPADRLEQIRALRRGLPQGRFLPRDINAFKRQGRR